MTQPRSTGSCLRPNLPGRRHSLRPISGTVPSVRRRHLDGQAVRPEGHRNRSATGHRKLLVHDGRGMPGPRNAHRFLGIVHQGPRPVPRGAGLFSCRRRVAAQWPTKRSSLKSLSHEGKQLCRLVKALVRDGEDLRLVTRKVGDDDHRGWTTGLDIELDPPQALVGDVQPHLSCAGDEESSIRDAQFLVRRGHIEYDPLAGLQKGGGSLDRGPKPSQVPGSTFSSLSHDGVAPLHGPRRVATVKVESWPRHTLR